MHERLACTHVKVALPSVCTNARQKQIKSSYTNPSKILKILRSFKCTSILLWCLCILQLIFKCSISKHFSTFQRSLFFILKCHEKAEHREDDISTQVAEANIKTFCQYLKDTKKYPRKKFNIVAAASSTATLKII